MATRKSTRRRPRRRPLRTSAAARPVGVWLRSHPALRLALALAKRKFGTLQGVCGFGIGRKVRERTGDYGVAPKRTGGMSILVLVREKQDLGKLRPEQRLPRTLLVEVPGEAKATRVPLDVVAIAEAEHAGATLDQVAGWPTANALCPGRTFTCSHFTVAAPRGTFASNAGVELGTVGAVVRQGGAVFVVSAGHVFVRTCDGETDAPKTGRGVGVLDRG